MYRCCHKCKEPYFNCHATCKMYKREKAVAGILRLNRNRDKEINEFEQVVFTKQIRRNG